jgi:hypothetical protein
MGNLLNILKKVLIAAVIVVVLLFVSVAVLIGVWSQSASEDPDSVYIYELKLSTTGPLENAKLLIHVPC